MMKRSWLLIYFYIFVEKKYINHLSNFSI
jgi:hypothetical protein